ncbi:MAG: S1/P1 Nuclease [Elusimicrobia bacterium]|nr:MAG: S1/P1 Nuclease [Elusimicrobiota bacterium]
MIKITVLVFILAASPVKAWGPIGHRVVGEIAENHLSDAAKKGVSDLLGNETLARAGTWADEMRSHPDKDYYGKFSAWHYATVPLGDTTYKDEFAPKKKGDVVQAMRKMEARLRSKKSDRKSKIEALRLLAHFIGDVHQPLHVGNGKDYGGNTCYVKWFGNPKKLHAVWDESLIDHLKLSYTEYAEFLDFPSKKQIKSWQSTSYAEWTNESVKIRPRVYPGTAKPEERKYCVKGWKARPDEELMPKLKWGYAFKHRKTLDARLLKAGVRLAGVLNSVFE